MDVFSALIRLVISRMPSQMGELLALPPSHTTGSGAAGVSNLINFLIDKRSPDAALKLKD